MPTLKEYLKDKLTPQELQILSSSYDIIGDIIIIEIRKGLEKKKHLIGKSLIELHPYIKVVCAKVGGHTGKYRRQKMEVIAGEDRKTTAYKENNITLNLDIEKCYFSPRLATERKRIFSLVKEGESVMVLFSGVGPYPITISKNTKAGSVYCIEQNPVAHAYALDNVDCNKVRNIVLFKGDVRKIVPKLKGKIFDRVIMPLPKGAESYLDIGLACVKKGGFLHVYSFRHEDDFSKAGKEIVAECKKQKRNCKLIRIVPCGQQSPRTYRICVDLRVI